MCGPTIYLPPSRYVMPVLAPASYPLEPVQKRAKFSAFDNLSGITAGLSRSASRLLRRYGDAPAGAALTTGTVYRESSLFLPRNSLFFELFSLLIFLGNCAKKRCNTAASCSTSVAQRPENAKFPVKFPVSREFAWRRVRSALRRQPVFSQQNQVLLESSIFHSECGQRISPTDNLRSVGENLILRMDQTRAEACSVGSKPLVTSRLARSTGHIDAPYKTCRPVGSMSAVPETRRIS
jgi:hypothetical protein